MPIFEGYIIDATTGETLAGATIQLNDFGKATDSTGYFKFLLPNNTYSANIRFLGYKTISTDVPIYENKQVTFKLTPDITTLTTPTITSTKTYKWLWVLIGAGAMIFIFKKWKR